jgi:hypothetical protein
MAMLVKRKLVKNVLAAMGLYVVSTVHREPPTKSSRAFVVALNWKATRVQVPTASGLLVAITL